MVMPILGICFGVLLIAFGILIFVILIKQPSQDGACFGLVVVIVITGIITICGNIFSSADFRDQVGDKITPINIHKHNNSIYVSYEIEDGSVDHFESDKAAIYNSTNIYVQETRKFNLLNNPCSSTYELKGD
jgi:hypothetical protein